MTLVEIYDQSDDLSRQQRWSHLLTVALALLMLLYGLNLRNSALSATTVYTNVRAGIRVNYPQNWLIDEAGDYVFRVRDMTRVGFKTTLLVQTLPIGSSATPRNIFDTLNINRPQRLSTYNPLFIEDVILPDESEGVRMTYTFVDTETNPFLESIPIAVIGQDILTVRGGQAIIITFLADAQTFETDRAIFDRFLASLEFR